MKLKRPYFDGRTSIKFSQVELLQKLALLIPPPRKNLTRYHGVFAPNHYLHSHIVNIGRPIVAAAEVEAETEPKRKSGSLPWAMLLKRVFAINVLECSDCGGRLKIIAVIPASEASEAILDHLERCEPKATGPPAVN